MKRYIYYLSLIYVLGSCSSFKEVKSFARTAEKSINSFKSINYTFSGNCSYKCTQRALENSVFQTIEQNCFCKEAILADKNVNRLLRVLKEYFTGLSNLSDSKLTNYSLDAIQKPLIEGKYIKKADIKPYTNITGLIITMFADRYRAKNLKRIIETANSDIILILETTIAILEFNLLPTLSNRQADIQQIYHDLYAAPVTTVFEKYNIQKMYFSELTTITMKKEALKKYIKGLKKISKGHQSLYDSKNKIKEKDVKIIISRYADELNAIVEQIKK